MWIVWLSLTNSESEANPKENNLMMRRAGLSSCDVDFKDFMMMRLEGNIPGFSVAPLVPRIACLIFVPHIACYRPHSYLQHAGISLNFKA